MKRLTYLLLSLTLILFSCHKTTPPNPPTASFSVDLTDPEVGQTVFFTNNSENGDQYEWDFGDGTGTSDMNPTHSYTATGAYDVKLTVTSRNGATDNTGLTLNVMVPTLLEIEVDEYYAPNTPVANASVILYPTLADWHAQTNKVQEAFTDADGIAVFANLDPFVYYVDVYEATHDNYQLAAEDAGFITTPQVITHKITGFVAYVDIVTHTSGVTRNREMTVKKIGRKASDKNLIPGFTGSWQDLLNRHSVKK